MKRHVLLILALLIIFVLGSVLYLASYFAVPEDWTASGGDPNLDIKCYLYEGGRPSKNISIEQDRTLFPILAKYLEDKESREGLPTFVSHAPVLMLQWGNIRVNFQSEVAVVSTRNGSQAVWKPRTRNKTSDDLKVEELLRTALAGS